MNKFLFISSISLVLWGCAAPKATVNVIAAPKIADAARFESIAIVNFQGKSGDSFARELEGILVNARVREQPVYRSVQRTFPPANRQYSYESYSDVDLVRHAAGTDAQAVITGEVLRADYQDKSFTEKKFVCDKRAKANGVIAQMFAPCESGRDVNVSCTTRTGSYAVAFRMLDGTPQYLRNFVS